MELGLGSLDRETAQLAPHVVPTAGLEYFAIEKGSTVVGPLEKRVAGGDLGRELDTDLKSRSAILEAGLLAIRVRILASVWSGHLG